MWLSGGEDLKVGIPYPAPGRVVAEDEAEPDDLRGLSGEAEPE